MYKHIMFSATAISVVLGLSLAAAQDRPPTGGPARNEPATQSRPAPQQPDAVQDRRNERQSQSNEQRPSSGQPQTIGQGAAGQPQSAQQGQPDRRQPATRPERAPDQPRAQGQQRSQPQEDQQRAQTPQDRQRAQPPDRREQAQPRREQSTTARDDAQNARRTPARSERDAQRRDDRGQRNARDRAAPCERQSGDTRQERRQERVQDRADRREQRAERADINEQQRARITASISRLNVRPLTNVNFSVSVGVTVPRSVRLEVLPADIVAIVPQYRGYRFAVVRDEIVIVHPRTQKIVAVMPYSGGSGPAQATAPRGGTDAVAQQGSGSISFSPDQRQTIRRIVVTRETTAIAPAPRIIVGETLPETVVVSEFPETVYRTIPSMRSYRYVVRGQDVYLIDPASRRVIEVIE